MKFLYQVILLTSIFTQMLEAKDDNPSSRIGLNFTSITAVDGVATIGLTPWNPTGPVGSTQYIASTYQAIRSFDKRTGKPDNVLNIDANSFIFNFPLYSCADTVMLYDTFAKRYIFSCEGGFISNLQIAVSDSDTITPQTQWSFYEIPPATINQYGASLDYNQAAFDEKAWYNGVGTFNDEGTFIGSTLTVIPKKSLLAGSPEFSNFYELFPEVISLVQEGFALPATNFDNDPQYGYFLWVIFDQPAEQPTEGNQLQFYRILDTDTDHPTLGPLVTVTTPMFAYNDLLAPHKGNLYGANSPMQNANGTIRSAHVRDHQLYFCQDLQLDDDGNPCSNGTHLGIRWYQFDMTGDPKGKGRFKEKPDTVPVLIQYGTLFDDELFYYMGSLMTNKNHDLCMAFTISGDDAYINGAYAFRKGCDPKGTLEGPFYVTNNSFPFNYAPHVTLFPGPYVTRWGDQSNVVVDPSNNRDFWLTQPVVAGQNYWGIQTTQVIPTKKHHK